MFVSARANRRGGIRSYPVLWHEASVCNMYNELLWEQIVMSVLNLLYSYLILIWHKLSDSQGKLHTGDLGMLSPPPVFDSINREYTLLWELIVMSVLNLLHSYLILIWHKLSASQWKLHTGNLGKLSLPSVCIWFNKQRLYFEPNKIVCFSLCFHCHYITNGAVTAFILSS